MNKLSKMFSWTKIIQRHYIYIFLGSVHGMKGSKSRLQWDSM